MVGAELVLALRFYGMDGTRGVTAHTDMAVTTTHGDLTDGTTGAGVATDGAVALVTAMHGEVTVMVTDGAVTTIFGAHRDTTATDMATEVTPITAEEEDITPAPLPTIPEVQHYGDDLM